MKKWQPIETAPKDRSVLLWQPSRGVCRAIWTTCDSKWSVEQDDFSWGEDDEKVRIAESPTHWMDLPERPL
jgi:hypothetical protein